MKFDLKKPCPGCPFLRDGDKAVRLRNAARVSEVWFAATHAGPNFPCHKTVDYDAMEEDRPPSKDEQHCLGAILAGIASGEGPNQLSRIMLRLRGIPAEAVSDENIKLVFDSEEEMAASVLEPKRRQKPIKKRQKPIKKRART